MASRRQNRKTNSMKEMTKAVETEKNTTTTAEAAVETVVETAKAVEEKATEVKEAVAEKAVEVKEAAAETLAEAKETVKKVAKKTTAKKEMKTAIVVEYEGKQAEEKAMVAAVKKAWQKSGNKVGDIKTMTLYVKPEENAVYYVINTDHMGHVALF